MQARKGDCAARAGRTTAIGNTYKLENALCSRLPLFEAPGLGHFHDVTQGHALLAGILQHLQRDCFVGARPEPLFLFLHKHVSVSLIITLNQASRQPTIRPALAMRAQAQMVMVSLHTTHRPALLEAVVGRAA